MTRYRSSSDPISPMARRIETWVARRMGDIGHERRVRALSTNLFDLTADRHDLRADWRRLLELAAVVHDVGRSIDDDGHELLGADLLMHASLPLPESDRRILACLTRHHRGKPPAHGSEQFLTRRHDRGAVRMLLALLRTADTLDNRNLTSPTIRFALGPNKLKIHCHLESDSLKARQIYRRRGKFRMIEDLLDLRIDFDLHIGGQARRAA
jgi:exopolyphosphatase/pppGpp-phosphohydrolase